MPLHPQEENDKLIRGPLWIYLATRAWASMWWTPIIGKLKPPATLRAFCTPTALYKTWTDGYVIDGKSSSKAYRRSEMKDMPFNDYFMSESDIVIHLYSLKNQIWIYRLNDIFVLFKIQIPTCILVYCIFVCAPVEKFSSFSIYIRNMCKCLSCVTESCCGWTLTSMSVT